MAITLKYGAPGPILLAGYAGGVGARQNRQQKDALDLWQQQNQQQFQAQQANLGRMWQAGLQQRQFEQQSELQKAGFEQQTALQQAGFGQQSTLQKTAIEARSKEEGETRKFQGEQAGLDREQRAALLKERDYQNTLEGVRTGALVLPEAAQNELNKLETGRLALLKDGFDEFQQKEGMAEYETRKRALLGLAQPRKQLSPDEFYNQNVTQQGRSKYQYIPGKGLDLLPEAPDPTAELNKQLTADSDKSAKYVYDESIRLAKEAGEEDVSPYVERAKKNLTAAGFRIPVFDQQTWNDLSGASQGMVGASRSPLMQAGGQATQSQATAASGSSADFDAKWATLKSGQSLRGPDGKIYVKQRQ